MDSERRSKTIIIVVVVLILGAAAWLARSFAHAPEKIESQVAADLQKVDATTPVPGVTSTPVSADGATTAPGASASPAGSPTASGASQPTGDGANAPLIAPALQAQFQSIRRETLALIPTQKQLQKLDHEEAHFTPKVLIAASLKIGEMAQLIADHPELANDGLRFYKECAEQNGSPNSVRASCLVNFVRLSKDHPGSVSAPQVTPHVRELAAKIMS